MLVWSNSEVKDNSWEKNNYKGTTNWKKNTPKTTEIHPQLGDIWNPSNVSGKKTLLNNQVYSVEAPERPSPGGKAKLVLKNATINPLQQSIKTACINFFLEQSFWKEGRNERLNNMDYATHPIKISRYLEKWDMYPTTRRKIS